MEQKIYNGRMELKALSGTGEFMAEFATLGVIDRDNDVTLPGAFRTGEEVIIEPWNHSWAELPVGKGVIREQDDKAVVDGRFFIDTEGGREHYQTIKNLGDIQEWSYSFDILEHDFGQLDNRDVRFLKRLEVIGVGPVTRGAGIDTRTVAIKGQKPFPNEHACRLRSPDDFQADSFRRITREHEGKQYSIVMGRLEGEDTMTEQAYRYPKDDWMPAEARKHCRDHDGTFEAAAEKVGARHTNKENEAIQQMHDLAIGLGAKCAEAENSNASDETEGQDEDRKGKSRSPEASRLAARLAIELLEIE